MQSTELLDAVTNVVKLLESAGIRSAVDKYRTSTGTQRTIASVKVLQSGATLVKQFSKLSTAELKVVECLHLESLGSSAYWKGLMATKADPKAQQTEMIRLSSRLIFANNHLPSLANLLDNAGATAGVPNAAGVQQPQIVLKPGEGALLIRLTDAGERACDPDRIARALDGIDMLYSACASLSRKPVIDLRLEGILAKENRDRDVRFTGDLYSIRALYAVIDSIPGALADIDPDQDIDLNAVVRSLPVFDDLHKLAASGTFSSNDINDITETMHQGALLTLESGIILIEDEPLMNHKDALATAAGVGVGVGEAQAATANTPNDGSLAPTAEEDEYFSHYKRQKDAMRHPLDDTSPASYTNGHSTDLNGAIASPEASADDLAREEAVDELLKNLGRTPKS